MTSRWNNEIYSSRKARLAHGVTVAESKTGGIIYTVGGSAEVSFKVKKADGDYFKLHFFSIFIEQNLIELKYHCKKW